MATTYTDTTLSQLIINKLTKQEYEGITDPDPQQLYLVPEELDDSVTENSTNPVQSGAVFSAIREALPAGVIVPYGGASAPAGWLLCDGSAISRTTYAALFAAIGTAFGTGDGSTTFNLPDMREVVPVGAGTSTNPSIAAHDTYNVGKFKDDCIQQHQHYFGAADSTLTSVGVMSDDGQNGSNVHNGSVTPWSSLGVRNVYGARTGTTTHGKQLGVNYIIKY